MSPLLRQRAHPHVTTLTADSNGKFGVPRTTLRLDNFLKGLTELTEHHYPPSYGLLQGKNRDEHQPKEGAGKLASVELSLSSLCSHAQRYSLNNDTCHHAGSTAYLGSSAALLCPETFSGLNHLLPAWLTFSLQLHRRWSDTCSLQPSGGRTDPAWP